MPNNFILSCESTADMPFSYMESRNIPVLFYTYSVNENEYTDNMSRSNKATEEFYKMLSDGVFPKTTQINLFKYKEFFKELLNKGDLLHIAFGSGMTASVNGAIAAAEELREEYPERKIIVIDSTCSCTGYGLLTEIAANMRDNGKGIEETAEFIEGIKHNIHHQFFSTDLKFFKKSGRVSWGVAAVGSVLGICPLMRLDINGKIVAYDKVRGKKSAVSQTVREIKEHIVSEGEFADTLYISHSNCIDLANATAEEIKKEIPALKKKIEFFEIGDVVASHCGPGTVAVFFVGDKRQ